MIVRYKTGSRAVRHDGSTDRHIDYRETIRSEIGIVVSIEHNLGPVADERYIVEIIFRGVVGHEATAAFRNYLPILIDEVAVCVALCLDAVWQVNHLPISHFHICALLYRQDRSIIAERKGLGAVADEVNGTLAVRKGQGYLICIALGVGYRRVAVFICSRIRIILRRAQRHCLHILLKITGAAHYRDAERMQILLAFSQGTCCGRHFIAKNIESDCYGLSLHSRIIPLDGR